MWEELHNLRDGQHLTYEKLGQLINVPGGTIASWENGGLPTWASRLMKLCEALNVTPNAILGWETTHKSELPTGATVIASDAEPDHKLLLDNDDIMLAMTIIRRRTDMLRCKMQNGKISQSDVDEVNQSVDLLDKLEQLLWEIMYEDGLPEEEIKGIIRESRTLR